MTEWAELLRIIDSCHSLFLYEIAESETDGLRLVLREGRVSPLAESIQVGSTRIENGHRVEPTIDSLVIELVWQGYVSYGVTNESFSKPEGRETPDSGRLLRRYLDSSFLAHISRSTIATEDYPGRFEHFQVISENHIIDVASMRLPTYRV